MNTTVKAGLLGLTLATLTACGDLSPKDPDMGTVKSVHDNDPKRFYVVCQAGSVFREVVLSEAIVKQVKVGDPCPTWETPAPATTPNDPYNSRKSW